MSARDLERLDDYATGVLADADADAFEEEMFAASGEDGELTADLRFYERAHRLIAWLSARVRLNAASTAADVDALRATGAKIHVIDVTTEKVEIGAWADDIDVVVLISRVDIRGYDDVEVEVENSDGTLVKTFRGVLGEPDTGNVYAICAAPLAKLAFSTQRRLAKMSGVRNGKRELITVFETVPV